MDIAPMDRSSSSCMAVSTAGVGAWAVSAAASEAQAASKIVTPVMKTLALCVGFIVAQN